MFLANDESPYQLLGSLGHGAHSQSVLLAEWTSDSSKTILPGTKVALKIISVDASGRQRQNWPGKRSHLEAAILRSISECASSFNQRHIVRLLDCIDSVEWKQRILILEYCPWDLRYWMEHMDTFEPSSITSIVWQILTGLVFLHGEPLRICHRDIKPGNILISTDGVVKLADFGLARHLDSQLDGSLTHQIMTRWYRAPELLYGSRDYSFTIDTWAVGCIMAELYRNGKPLFPGQSDIDQLLVVLGTLGSPTEDQWPEMKTLPDYGKIIIEPMSPIPMSELIPNLPAEAEELLRGLLQFSGKKRFTAEQALQCNYFNKGSANPGPILQLPSMPKPFHTFDNNSDHEHDSCWFHESVDSFYPEIQG